MLAAMKTNCLFIASDHAGFSAKKDMAERAANLAWEVVDLGPFSEDRVDYPDFANLLCHKILTHPEARGLLICGSGQGMAMRANKFTHIRAALCWNAESAQLARAHNNANVLCVGARLVKKTTLTQILEIFLKEDFEGGRHQGRVEKISKPLNEGEY